MDLSRSFPSPARSLLFGLVLTAIPVLLQAQAQATTGVIRGVITDSARGGALAGAVVTLRNAETNAERVLTTNESGVYVATLLRVGTYDVAARALGFQEARKSKLTLRLGETLDVPFALVPQVVQLQEISVVAEPLIDVTSSESATRLSAEAVEGLPNNGRNIFNFTTLTPNVAIVQGPDGDEISVGGQRGIHNNVSVDGADFNNPFFGEQRGGQRPAFTFNLDAVQDFVVVADGANAEFGRSSGGFINVITKSGTNEFHGSAHYFGKYDGLSADFRHTFPSGTTSGFVPDFRQHQFGGTFGGPLVRDKAFFFLAYDQQEYNETKQTTRLGSIDPALIAFTDTAFGGALAGDFGPISRTNDAKALLAKLDFRLSPKHNATLKYNYTKSSQENGTFDVDSWGRSANALENDHSHAVNGSLTSLFSSSLSNEFRFQWAREDRPRPYTGPINPASGRPFPDTYIGFVDPSAGFSGYRVGMPFFIPVDAHDYRLQFLDNVSLLKGNHLIKAGAEWNRTGVSQTFRGFGNGMIEFESVDGFMNYVANGNGYVTCADDITNAPTPSQNTGSCPTGEHVTGPVRLYLQQAGIGGLTVDEAGTQTIIQNELALFLQDSWKPRSNLTVNYGLRWETQIEPSLITPIADLFYAPFIGQTVTNSFGTFAFPGDGTIPSDYKMFQPRLGIAYDVKGDGKQVIRANAGLYYARIPGLNLASSRSTDGSRGQTMFRNSFLNSIGVLPPPPNYGELLATPSGGPFQPGVFVFDKDFQNPRTFTATLGYEREVGGGVAAGLSYTHARTDHLTRFVNANDAVFGSPWATGLAGGNGIGTLTVVQSTAKSRFNGITAELRRTGGSRLQFQANYTLSFDKSDDDNERDPFSLNYVRADSLQAEYNWSDRDQRHRFNAWVLAILPGDFYLNNRVSAYSAQPASESCGPDNTGTGTRVAVNSALRICPDGHILRRNTIRKDNAYFSWDIRLSKPFNLGRQGTFEVIFEAFNVTNTDNFRDPSPKGTFDNFDGTIRSGLGEPRQFQAGVRYIF